MKEKPKHLKLVTRAHVPASVTQKVLLERLGDMVRNLDERTSALVQITFRPTDHMDDQSYWEDWWWNYNLKQFTPFPPDGPAPYEEGCHGPDHCGIHNSPAECAASKKED